MSNEDRFNRRLEAMEKSRGAPPAMRDAAIYVHDTLDLALAICMSALDQDAIDPTFALQVYDRLHARRVELAANELEYKPDYRCAWVDRSGYRCAEPGTLTYREHWYCREHVSWAEADYVRRQGGGA